MANLKVGSTVFYHHPERGWSIGQLRGAAGKLFEVDDRGDIHKVAAEGLHRHMDGAYSKEFHDLFQMGDLHQATLLYCLKDRYVQDKKMYTRMGDMLISINPFERMPYNDESQMSRHMETAQAAPPHIWEIANKAFVKIIKQDRNNQSILISGESGAGKTESTKTLIDYLGKMSMRMAGCNAVQKEIGQTLNRKLKASNPILESFGNAKTSRNDNSSRFGKYIKLYFNKASGVLVGAEMEHYLLEKSRIVTQNPGERGYHVFYEMLAGMTPQQKQKYGGLTKAEDYPSLFAGQQTLRVLNGKITAQDDQEWAALLRAFQETGITDEQQDMIFTVLASILWLQKVQFVTDESTGKAKVKNPDILAKVAALLKVDAKALGQAIVTVSQTKVMTKYATVPEAEDMRDALSKAMYSGMFDWIVDRLNVTIKPTAACMRDEIRYIGLLDIFGFENFDVNTFEQFCINYTNESLQNHYNGYTFIQDEAECKQEGITCPHVDYPDNQKCLDMLDLKKLGVFSLLDGECQYNLGTDGGFTEKVWEQHGGNDYFIKPRSTRPDRFGVNHYAASVTYMTAGWRDKNSDTLNNPIKEVMGASATEFVRGLLPPMVDEKDRKKASTVASKFKAQLQALRAELSSTESHFVRTVKPNPEMKPGMIHNDTVMKQLTSAGVIETIKMKRAGYPVRLKHQDFFLRNRIIAPQAIQARYGHGVLPRTEQELKDACREICASLLPPVKDIRQFDIGYTKVFCKAAANERLEAIRHKVIERAKRVSRAFIYRWGLSWMRMEKQRAEALRVRKIEEDKIRVEKKKAREEALKRHGTRGPQGNLRGPSERDFSDFVSLFPHFDIPIINDAVRLAHERFGASDAAKARKVAQNFLLDIQKQKLAAITPVPILAIFEEAGLSSATQKTLHDKGINNRTALFSLTSEHMDSLGFSRQEKENLQAVMLKQQSDWVINQRLNLLIDAGNRTPADVDRDMKALNKAADTIRRQLAHGAGGVPASAVGRHGASSSSSGGGAPGAAAPAPRGGYTADQVQRFVAMGFPESKARDALRKCNGDAKRAVEVLLSQT